MINYLLQILVGLFAGVLGGMGMGGGTLLIPLLTIVLGFSQRMAQAINLISFSVMAIFVVAYHIRNKMIDKEVLLIFLFSTTLSAVVGAFVANSINANVLKRLFGVLLLVIAVYLLICQVVQIKKRKQ